jgi:formylglycine-generating enzyme required for sulfatase activity
MNIVGTPSIAPPSSVPNAWLWDPECSLLRAWIQVVGSLHSTTELKSIPESLSQKLHRAFEFDPDPGIHASIEWTLRRLGKQGSGMVDSIRDHLAQERVSRTGWFVTGNGHTLTVLNGPIEFVAGAELDDPDRDAGSPVDPTNQEQKPWSEDHPHTKRIGRSYAIAMHETSFRQLHEFDASFHILHNIEIAPRLEHPANRVSWYRAAAYCNWLSRQEGIPESQWCFVPNERGEYAAGMRVAEDYLHRVGYRLPTEAEWEYACRAGTRTRRYFGDANELAEQYIWFERNSQEIRSSIPGSLKPNELGLFDTFGNVMEWCIDPFDVTAPGSRFRPTDDELFLDNGLSRIIRGASLFTHLRDIRASEYSQFAPTYREGNTGFRVAKTLSVPTDAP